jgi:predicted helicase
MPSLTLKPTHKAIVVYYDNLAKFAKLGIKYESAVRTAFHELLEHCARQFDWKLVPEYALKRKGHADAKADGALLDNSGLRRGLWEAKDSNDDLEKEIKNKFSIGYPKENILFWQPDKAVLFQNSERFYEADLTKPDDLVKILSLFLEFAPPAIAEWEKAVDEFKNRIPELGAQLGKLIETERQTNQKFIAAFEDFCSLCRGSLNPSISVAAVEEMIIQHILTERIFRKVFAIADFISRNVIAQEIEKVITALNSRAFSRDDFSKNLEYFYQAIEHAAATITDFHEKQNFLNTVYERFFQGFCVKVADTHGIVYTPQPLVNFMVASVEHVLQAEFNKTLADKDVHILDPFTGTGNFIVNVMRHIAEKQKSALPHKYAHELHCNEIMLLPYYVASMNIEHAYYEATGKYESFEGICLVDTFQTYEGAQAELALLSEKNSQRVERQKKAPIRVIIANPPYNAGQTDENDNNKNRKYKKLDDRVSNTYASDSQATLLRKLSDPYVKAIRQATDRIGDAGIVCFVNNNSFVADYSFDGMRKHLARDFDLIYVLDLGGNVRKGQTGNGNVFGIMVGVSINLFIKLPKNKVTAKRAGVIKYFEVADEMSRKEKFELLNTKKDVSGIKWKTLKPDDRHDWFPNPTDEEFEGFLPIGSKDAKAGVSVPTIFRTYSPGVNTARDKVVYDFSAKQLAQRIELFCEDFNGEIVRWAKKGHPQDIDSFVNYDKLKWSRNLKRLLHREKELVYKKANIRRAIYRPFTDKRLYFSKGPIDEIGDCPSFFPNAKTEEENRVIAICDVGYRAGYTALVCNCPFDLHVAATTDLFQGYPLYLYSEDGKHKQENITPKARTLFQIFYDDDSITAADIFHYVYAVLHHPAYRTRYAENLKRDLPRIPFIGAAAAVHSLAPSDGERAGVRGKHKARLTPTLSPHPMGGEGENAAAFFPLSAIATMQGEARPAHNPAASAKLFHAFADAGKKLAALHVNYESAKEYKLKRQENKEVKLDWRVEAMKLSKDKASLFYNDFLTLSGIPPEVFAYKLGNRSALEWVIDQYRVTRDAQGNIASDPNRMDDEEYIVRLIGQVITVSLETMKVVSDLPELKFGGG